MVICEVYEQHVQGWRRCTELKCLDLCYRPYKKANIDECVTRKETSMSVSSVLMHTLDQDRDKVTASIGNFVVDQTRYQSLTTLIYST